ncbi:sugar transferase [Calothrix sp. NIES-2100]|uniref:sugar transferase n=1 Tax=Calothrix sp. NIES-2100 TaxID=1954172 RepID=UPI000B6143FF|nr:sugar transferase [Calothrix sp. NIES-2100]
MSNNFIQIIKPQNLIFPKNQPLYYLTKRLFDITVAACVLILFAPLILTGALLVKLTSPGPAFYKAKRAGLGGKPFYMLKLRSMYINTDSLDRRITEKNDNRITFVGAILRKLKIDELPQFWNVLCGQMSIIGPRPEDWDIVEKYYTPEQRLTLEIVPGLASISDVNWYPDITYHHPCPPGVSAQEDYIKRHLPILIDEALSYMEQQSFLFDLKLMARIAFAIVMYSWAPPKRQQVSLGDTAS